MQRCHAEQLAPCLPFQSRPSPLFLSSEMRPNSAASENSQIEPEQKFKLVFLGEQSVGKSSIINRFMYDSFDSTYQATIGIDFLSKVVAVDGRPIRLQMWDTAGQERFHCLTPSYIRDSSVVVIVYDITNAASFAKVRDYAESARAIRENQVEIFVVANKSDMAEGRVVTEEQGKALGRDLKAFFCETSAKTGTAVAALFTSICSSLPNSNLPQAPATQRKAVLPFISTVGINLNAQNISPDHSAAAERRGVCCVR